MAELDVLKFLTKSNDLPTFDEWWKLDGSKYYQEKAKEAARYTWTYCWNKAGDMLKESMD